MGIANIPKWTFISIILAVILIIRGIFDSNVSLILGIIISLLTIILFIGIPSLLMKKSEKGYRFKNNSGPLKFQIKHFGLGHQIFDNTGLGILLILLLIMDFGVYISIPLVNTKTGKIVMDFLDKMHKEGKTIIMITHDPQLAQDHAEIVYWLLDGKLEKVTGKDKKLVKIKSSI